MTYVSVDVHAAPTMTEVREIKNNPQCQNHVVLRLQTADGSVVHFFQHEEIEAVAAALHKAVNDLNEIRERYNELPMERSA